MGHLAQVVADLEEAGVGMLHFDLEDGHFVPAVMTLGTRLIGELRPLTDLHFDVHLMVSEPEVMIPVVAELGCNSIAAHYEACPYPRRTLRQIRALGLQAGLAFNPRTPLPELDYLASLLDYVVILTTEPELPDWPFIPEALESVRAAAAFAQQRHPELSITADGGFDAENIHLAVEAGANVIVAGRGTFAGGRIGENVRAMQSAARQAIR